VTGYDEFGRKLLAAIHEEIAFRVSSGSIRSAGGSAGKLDRLVVTDSWNGVSCFRRDAVRAISRAIEA